MDFSLIIIPLRKFEVVIGVDFLEGVKGDSHPTLWDGVR